MDTMYRYKTNKDMDTIERFYDDRIKVYKKPKSH